MTQGSHPDKRGDVEGFPPEGGNKLLHKNMRLQLGCNHILNTERWKNLGWTTCSCTCPINSSLGSLTTEPHTDNALTNNCMCLHPHAVKLGRKKRKTKENIHLIWVLCSVVSIFNHLIKPPVTVTVTVTVQPQSKAKCVSVDYFF